MDLNNNNPEFIPAWWLRNAHAQTIWQTLFRRGSKISLRRECLELSDGDFVDLDWTSETAGPVVVMLHGLEGSSRSSYANGMMLALHRAGYNTVLLHFRGCGGTPNRLMRRYHAGDTGDVAEVVRHLKQRMPDRSFYGVGYSLGGNVLLKWMGETGDDNPLAAAVVVSVPFDLDRVANRLESGASRLYQHYMLRKLKRGMRTKSLHAEFPISAKKFQKISRLRVFDDHVTAPLHGFVDSADYYRRASCRPYLLAITKPCLIIHSKDDPFMDPGIVPRKTEISPSTEIICTKRGGHVGFIEGGIPFRPRYWLERATVSWLGKQRNPDPRSQP